MQTLSDILIIFAKNLDDDAMAKAKAYLMNVSKSVLVHQKEGQSRVLLVKFAPSDATPGSLLETLRSAGFDAKISGG